MAKETLKTNKRWRASWYYIGWVGWGQGYWYRAQKVVRYSHKISDRKQSQWQMWQTNWRAKNKGTYISYKRTYVGAYVRTGPAKEQIFIRWAFFHSNNLIIRIITPNLAPWSGARSAFAHVRICGIRDDVVEKCNVEYKARSSEKERCKSPKNKKKTNKLPKKTQPTNERKLTKYKPSQPPNQPTKTKTNPEQTTNQTKPKKNEPNHPEHNQTQPTHNKKRASTFSHLASFPPAQQVPDLLVIDLEERNLHLVNPPLCLQFPLVLPHLRVKRHLSYVIDKSLINSASTLGEKN